MIKMYMTLNQAKHNQTSTITAPKGLKLILKKGLENEKNPVNCV